MRVPYVPNLIARLAPEIGARVEIEPEFGFAGRIIFADGATHVFKANNVNINRGAAIAIADDKNYTNYFLRAAGFDVPREIILFGPRMRGGPPPDKRRTLEDARAFAGEIGYPVFVKPNDGSLGDLVIKAHTPDDLTDGIARVLADYPIALIQQFVTGQDYRVVVLGDEVICAYHRTALTITGDGRSTIGELLLQRRRALPDQHRPNSEIDPNDFRIEQTLMRHSLDRASILLAGVVQPLLDNANLSSGGEAIDITERLAPDVAAVAIRAARTIGLNLSGVDIICRDATVSADDCVVLELNASPGLDNYAAIGDAQRQRVEAMYRKVLRFLETNAALGS